MDSFGADVSVDLPVPPPRFHEISASPPGIPCTEPFVTPSVNERCHLDLIGDEILHNSLTWLSPSELLGVYLLNKRISALIGRHDQDLWTNHVREVWRKTGWTHNVPLDVCLLHRVKSQLSMIELKRTLLRVDTSRCLEKQDFQVMTAAFLLFGLRGVNPPTNVKKSLKTYLPQWALEMGIFKASYFFALKETRRTKEVTKTELCAISWRFFFKHEQDMDGDYVLRSKFREDNTMTSDMHNNILTWDWWEVEGQPRMVRVEQYPPLHASRLSNGLWRMENMYVFMIQEESLDEDKIPLI